MVGDRSVGRRIAGADALPHQNNDAALAEANEVEGVLARCLCRAPRWCLWTDEAWRAPLLLGTPLDAGVLLGAPVTVGTEISLRPPTHPGGRWGPTNFGGTLLKWALHRLKRYAAALRAGRRNWHRFDGHRDGAGGCACYPWAPRSRQDEQGVR